MVATLGPPMRLFREELATTVSTGLQNSRPQKNASVTGLPAGKHVLTVTDAYGVVRNSSIIILEPERLNARLTQGELACPNATDAWAAVSVSGGSGGYTFAWSSNIAANATSWENSTANVTLLASDSYNVTITDSNSCAVTMPFRIAEPDLYCQNAGVCSGIVGNLTCNCTDGWEGDDCSQQIAAPPPAIRAPSNAKAVRLGVGIGVGVGVPIVAGAIVAVVLFFKSSLVAVAAPAAATV